MRVLLPSVAFTVLLEGSSSLLGAQAWSYPALQPPRIVEREFNFGVADASGSGTTAFFQWREDYGPRQQLSLDVGIADPDRPPSDIIVFVGGQYAYQVSGATDDVPLDFLLAGGANLAIGPGGFSLLRLPAGVSVGHRFALEGDLALTPFVHPRITLDFCRRCGSAGGTRSDVAVTFDVGANLDITSTIAVRGAALFSGSRSVDNDGFGVSLAWSPPGLARRGQIR
jgi:hypothetical protein